MVVGWSVWVAESSSRSRAICILVCSDQIALSLPSLFQSVVDPVAGTPSFTAAAVAAKYFPTATLTAALLVRSAGDAAGLPLVEFVNQSTCTIVSTESVEANPPAGIGLALDVGLACVPSNPRALGDGCVLQRDVVPQINATIREAIARRPILKPLLPANWSADVDRLLANLSGSGLIPDVAACPVASKGSNVSHDLQVRGEEKDREERGKRMMFFSSSLFSWVCSSLLWVTLSWMCVLYACAVAHQINQVYSHMMCLPLLLCPPTVSSPPLCPPLRQRFVAIVNAAVAPAFPQCRVSSLSFPAGIVDTVRKVRMDLLSRTLFLALSF